MFSFLEEIFLREYFLHIAVLSGFAPAKKLFAYLAKAFGVSTRRANVLHKLTEQESVQEIATEADADRYKRVVQYLQENGRPCLYDTQTDMVITIKSEAITVAAQADLCADNKSTKSKVYQHLFDRANSGSVEAMRVLGVLQLNGFFVEKDWSAGRDNLVKAAEWGDVISMFLLIRAGVKYSNVYLNFYAATQNTPYSILYEIAGLEKPGDYLQSETEFWLLNKLFNQKLVKKSIYSPAHAYVLYATGINREDKEKILLSENKQLLTDVLSLPIYRPIEELHCCTDDIKSILLHREGEQNQIVTALRNRDLRKLPNYKPLCLSVNSLHLQEIYASAIERCFRQEVVQRINVSNLQERDFDPTANNVFVRNCKCTNDDASLIKFKNDTNNVFLLFLNGDIPDSILNHIKDFLSSDWRHQVRLSHPSIILDFGYTLPICICDSNNAKKLKNLVEKVQIADMDCEEKTAIIHEMLRQKEILYFKKIVEITDKDLLYNLSLETAEEVMDTAFRMLRNKLLEHQDNVAVAIKPFIDKYQQHHTERGFGFGGYNK